MSKLLNLDAIASSKNVILNGATRIVKGMTVNQFLTAGDWDARYSEADAVKRVEMIIDLVADFLPDTPREDLLTLSLDQLGALMNFVRGIEPAADPQ